MNDHKPHWLIRLYIWATYRLYNEFAWMYDLVSWLVSFGRWADWRRSVLDFCNGPHVLEIGFGTGELLLELQKMNFRVVGLDASNAMHRIVRRKLAKSDANIPLIMGLSQNMPFMESTFDTIVSTFPASFILESATLQEVSRLLKPADPQRETPGGQLVIVGLVSKNHRSQLWKALDRWLSVDPQKMVDDFTQKAQDAGLQVIVKVTTQNKTSVPVYILRRKGSVLL